MCACHLCSKNINTDILTAVEASRDTQKILRSDAKTLLVSRCHCSVLESPPWATTGHSRPLRIAVGVILARQGLRQRPVRLNMPLKKMKNKRRNPVPQRTTHGDWPESFLSQFSCSLPHWSQQPDIFPNSVRIHPVH